MRGNKHGFAQKALFAMLFVWNILNILLAWFSVGNAYVAVLIVFNTAGGLADKTHTDTANPICSNQQTVSHGIAVAYNILILFYEIMQVRWDLGRCCERNQS